MSEVRQKNQDLDRELTSRLKVTYSCPDDPTNPKVQITRKLEEVLDVNSTLNDLVISPILIAFYPHSLEYISWPNLQVDDLIGMCAMFDLLVKNAKAEVIEVIGLFLLLNDKDNDYKILPADSVKKLFEDDGTVTVYLEKVMDELYKLTQQMNLCDVAKKYFTGCKENPHGILFKRENNGHYVLHHCKDIPVSQDQDLKHAFDAVAFEKIKLVPPKNISDDCKVPTISYSTEVFFPQASPEQTLRVKELFTQIKSFYALKYGFSQPVSTGVSLEHEKLKEHTKQVNLCIKEALKTYLLYKIF